MFTGIFEWAERIDIVISLASALVIAMSSIFFLRKKLKQRQKLGTIKHLSEEQFFDFLKDLNFKNFYIINFEAELYRLLSERMRVYKIDIFSLETYEPAIVYGPQFLDELTEIFQVKKFDNIYSIQDNAFVNTLMIKDHKNRILLINFNFHEQELKAIYTWGLSTRGISKQMIQSLGIKKTYPGVGIGLTKLFNRINQRYGIPFDALGDLLSFNGNTNIVLKDLFLSQFHDEMLKSDLVLEIVTTDLTFDPMHTLSRESFLRSNKDFINQGKKLTRIFIPCNKYNYQMKNKKYQSYQEYLKDLYMVICLEFTMGIKVYLSHMHIGQEETYEYDVIKYGLTDNHVLSLVQDKAPKNSYTNASATLFNSAYRFDVIDAHILDSDLITNQWIHDFGKKTYKGKTFASYYLEYEKKNAKMLEGLI